MTDSKALGVWTANLQAVVTINLDSGSKFWVSEAWRGHAEVQDGLQRGPGSGKGGGEGQKRCWRRDGSSHQSMQLAASQSSAAPALLLTASPCRPA